MSHRLICNCFSLQPVITEHTDMNAVRNVVIVAMEHIVTMLMELVQLDVTRGIQRIFANLVS